MQLIYVLFMIKFYFFYISQDSQEKKAQNILLVIQSVIKKNF